MSIDLSGRIALVIGGAAGIGLASSAALAAAGAHVLIADRDADAATKAVLDLRALGRSVSDAHVDASCADDLERLFRRIGEEHGHLDIVFSNAGTTGPDGFDFSAADFDHTFDLNVKAHFAITELARPLMQAAPRGGSIIYMSSAAALRAGGRSPLYSVSKAAIPMLARTYARELGPYGIRVNAICPGHVRTAFPLQWLQIGDAQYEALVADRAKAIPLGRIAEPEDIANVVLFLASDLSTYLTGLALPVDGGVGA